MADDLDTYLKELQKALTGVGADPALVQDALFDAEEHLRTELAERYEGLPSSTEEYQTRFAAVMEDYGTPLEVASFYFAPIAEETVTAEAPEALTTPTDDRVAATAVSANAPSTVVGELAITPVTRPSVLEQIFGVVVDPAVYKALLYMLLSLATGIIYFTVVVTGISTTVGMFVLIVGVPLFLLVLAIVRGMSLVEGRLVETLLGMRMPRRERADLPEAGWLKRIAYWLKDGRTWASMAYMVLMLPLGIVYFTIAVTGLAVGFGMVFWPLAIWLDDHILTWQGVDHVFHLPLWTSPMLVIGGVILLVLWLHMVRWIGRGHAVFAKHMLVRLSR